MLRFSAGLPRILACACLVATACATARPEIQREMAEVSPELRAEVAAALREAPAALGLVDSASAVGGLAPSGPPRILLGPMVGHTTDRSATVWLQTDRPGRVRVELIGANGDREDSELDVLAEDGHTAIVQVGGLDPATEYSGRVSLDGAPLRLEPELHFRTFPPTGEPGRFRIALVSCARTDWDSVQTIWRTIARDRPDVVVWLGDNAYFEHGDSAAGIPADYASVGRMAYRHAELRALASLQPVLRTIPNYATWDDHDYGDSDSDRTFPLREAAAVLFMRYWANAYYGGDGLDGIWTHFRIGDVEVLLIDDRFWRDPNDAPDSPAKTMLGSEQKAWLKERLAESDARVKVVAVGVQVLADYHEWESYAKYAHERDELLRWLRDERVEGVVFVSGDRHLSELQRADREGLYPLWELTASPVANRPFVTGLEIPNPIRVDGYGAGFNYGVLEIDTTPQGGTIAFKILDAEGKEAFSHTARLDDLRIR